MAIPNSIQISYGSTTVGGSTPYQLHGPYILDKSFDQLRLVFDVIITSASQTGLQSLSEDLEDAFRERLTAGQRLIIGLGGSSWTYVTGQSLLRPRASIVKSGNPDTDRGLSRAYTITINGELPADGSIDNGLRDIELQVELSPSRQQTVTMRGVYTATSSGNAVQNYESNADGVASSYLSAIDNQATWELVAESYSMDRERGNSGPASHICTFTRQYIQLLFNQTEDALDDPQIRDHRVTFTDTSSYPGDGQQDIFRLHRVIANYDCGINIEQTQDIKSVYENKVRPHLLALFESNFEPQVFAVEDERASYDHTGNRMAVAMQMVFQPSGGTDIVEVSQSVAVRESRTIDYTPIHEDDEFAYEVDLGWAVLERIWQRTVIAIGSERPALRISERPSSNVVGGFIGPVGSLQGPDNRDGTQLVREGWNIVASTSQVTPQWIGNPDDEQIQVSVLTENVTERYSRRPGPRTRSPILGPTT